jgi:hypothetical protein
MLKSEMSEDQLADRAAFVERVSAAGWDLGGWEQLFEAEADLKPEAQAELHSPRAFLRLSYHANDDYVLLECAVPAEGGAGVGGAGVGGEGATLAGARIRFYPVNDLGAIVGRVVAAQDTLSPATLPKLVKRIKPLCNYVLMETEDGIKFL